VRGAGRGSPDPQRLGQQNASQNRGACSVTGPSAASGDTRARATNPLRLRPISWRALPRATTPFRVVICRFHSPPRVARASQPWALLQNPFGILARSDAGHGCV
jgi:hypothetical protein